MATSLPLLEFPLFPKGRGYGYPLQGLPLAVQNPRLPGRFRTAAFWLSRAGRATLSALGGGASAPVIWPPAPISAGADV